MCCNKTLFLFAFLSLVPDVTRSQTYDAYDFGDKYAYKYDCNGNVVSRLLQNDAVAVETQSDTLMITIDYKAISGTAVISVSTCGEELLQTTVSVYDTSTNMLLGRKEFNGETYDMDLSTFPNGLYIVEAICGQEKVAKKIRK